MSSIMIISGNEPYPECFVAGYRTAFNCHNANKQNAEYNLQTLWSVDYDLMRTAMQKQDEMTIYRILNGCLSESSRLEFPFVAFTSPEMYFWAQTLQLYPVRGQIIRLVSAIKAYICEYLLPQKSQAKLGIVGSSESAKLFSELPDYSVATRQLQYSFCSPNAQIVSDLTALRYAKKPPDITQAHHVCRSAIDDIIENYHVDGIILADLEVERWLKSQNYLEHLTEVASHQRLYTIQYDPLHQQKIFILSAMQALISGMARDCSYSRIPDHN